MKMESVKSKTSKKLMKRPALSSFKKALSSSFIGLSKTKAKKGATGFRAKAVSRRKEKPSRGTIYISHLPHGFYEEQIKEYFSQFGIVTGVSVPRSKRTGRTQGHAFVQFLNNEVAEIAAQSMNKYLMSNRLLEASVVEPYRARVLVFTNSRIPPVTPETCTKAKNRRAFIAQKNLRHTELQHNQMVQEELGKLKSTQKKLAALGLPEVELEL